jgi:O-antigen/teichoic acid export membrane protein
LDAIHFVPFFCPMSSPTIQRQSIVSTLVIFLGFGFGALNLIILQPRILTTEQWGLTRVISEAAVLLANFATLGALPINAKFFPYYKRYLPYQRIDLPAITGSIFMFGLALTIGLIFLFKPFIIKVFGKNNTLFEPYFYTLIFFIILQGTFLFMEIFAWYAGRTILANFLKELLFRFLTTIALALLAFKLIDFDGFMLYFSLLYLPLVGILFYYLKKSNGLPIYFSFSKVTRRFKKIIAGLGSFVFLTNISQIAFIVCDTLFLAGMYSLAQAGIYAVAQYFSNVLEVPMRSMQTSSVPRISEYWRAKNMSGLQSVYRKSCINLLVTGMGLGGLIIVNLHNLEKFFPPAYSLMVIPVVLLIVARWINLATGLNAIIIQLSTWWRFDFASTLIYSVIGIPLNYLLIRNYGMIGAASATIIAMTLYNGLRFGFLYYKFNLQPFTYKNLILLLGGLIIIAGVYALPNLSSLYLDGILRSLVFAIIFGFFVIRFRISDEVNGLYENWVLPKNLKQNTLKKVLIITYYWPPCGGIGVLRCLKFAKYLRKYGWEPIIFTADDAHYPSIDYSNDKDIPEGIQVLKQKIWEPYHIYKYITGQKPDANVNNVFYASEKKTGPMHNLSVWIRSNFFIPDARALWIKPSVKYLLAWLKDNPVDAIVSNGPPHSNTRIATLLKKATGIPWLADFQDPWSQVDYFSMLKLTRWGRQKHLRMEQEVFQYADAVSIVGPTWKKDLESIGARDVQVLPWGFDREDFKNLQPMVEPGFSCTHTGILGIDRNPTELWDALQMLETENPGLYSDFHVHLIGLVDSSVQAEAKQRGLDKKIKITGAVERSTALAFTQGSQFFVAGTEPSGKRRRAHPWVNFSNTSPRDAQFWRLDRPKAMWQPSCRNRRRDITFLSGMWPVV